MVLILLVGVFKSCPTRTTAGRHAHLSYPLPMRYTSLRGWSRYAVPRRWVPSGHSCQVNQRSPCDASRDALTDEHSHNDRHYRRLSARLLYLRYVSTQDTSVLQLATSIKWKLHVLKYYYSLYLFLEYLQFRITFVIIWNIKHQIFFLSFWNWSVFFQSLGACFPLLMYIISSYISFLYNHIVISCILCFRVA